ncbi:MAG: hypothetical protein Q8P57_04950 [Candidatus Pacearchaeota archaeon]|nr:hypothetical protein [Candidatus Pacearchaeota archaeon]
MIKNKVKKVEKKPAKERKLEKELLGILLFIVFLAVVFVIAGVFFKSLNNFEYNGVKFTEEKLGNIPIFHHFYFLKGLDGKLIKYNFYLRNDPRELDKIPIEGEGTAFDRKSAVFISVDPKGIDQCKQGPLAIASLSSFLSDNQLSVLGGNLNFWDAGYKRQEWVTCENRPGNIVIEISEGNETRIDLNGKCYKIQVSSCQILEAVERLELQIVVDATQANT